MPPTSVSYAGAVQHVLWVHSTAVNTLIRGGGCGCLRAVFLAGLQSRNMKLLPGGWWKAHLTGGIVRAKRNRYVDRYM